MNAVFNTLLYSVVAIAIGSVIILAVLAFIDLTTWTVGVAKALQEPCPRRLTLHHPKDWPGAPDWIRYQEGN